MNSKQRKILSSINSCLTNYKNLTALQVDVSDYSGPIVTEDYALVGIEPTMYRKIENLIKAFDLETIQFPDCKERVKFIFASGDFSVDRAQCHLHNRFAKSISQSKPFLFGLNLEYGDWTFSNLSVNANIEISMNGIHDIAQLMVQPKKAPSDKDVDVQFILNELMGLGKSTHIFRGINVFYSEVNGISTSIYRNNKDLYKIGKLQDVERSIAQNLIKQKYYKSDRIVDALTDLRHRGKDTCLLDFTKNQKVALFFACHGKTESSRPGELLIVEKSKLKEIDEIKYPVDRDCILLPGGTETKGRVAVQESMFVYCHKGFLHRMEYGGIIQNLLICNEIKPLLLEMSGFTEDQIYPDFEGFLENPNNFDIPGMYFTAVKLLEDDEIFDAYPLLCACQDSLNKDWSFNDDIQVRIDECFQKLRCFAKQGKRRHK